MQNIAGRMEQFVTTVTEKDTWPKTATLENANKTKLPTAGLAVSVTHQGLSTRRQNQKGKQKVVKFGHGKIVIIVKWSEASQYVVSGQS